MRISGLASGMDTDTMVSDLMKAQRIPLDKLKQKKQILEWQRDDYRSINTLLLNFRSELTNMKLTSSYRARGTTSTDESKITATATSAASLASYSVSKVSQLASAASKVNTGTISSSTQKVSIDKALTEIGGQFVDSNFNWQTGSAESQTISASALGKNFRLNLMDGVTVQNTDSVNVKVNGTSYEVVTAFSSDTTKNQVKIDAQGNLTFNKDIAKDSSIKVDFVASHSVQEISMADSSTNFTLSDIAKHSSSKVTGIKINSGGTVSNYTVEGTSIKDSNSNVVGTIGSDGKVTMQSSIAKDAKIEVSFEQKYSSFSIQTFGPDNKINKEFFNVAGTDTLTGVINNVNSSSVGVTLMYDSVSDRMTLTRKETGNYNKPADGIAVTPANSHEIITSGSIINDVFKFNNATETGGENAKFIINGLETERNSNTFSINGVTFSLKTTFSDTPVTVNITNNSTQIFDNIKGFITKYNELISKIQSEVQEERYKSYTPLTDTQREQLSDTQQEQWEEKAKSGMLRRDPTLTSLLSNMRMDISNPVSDGDINGMYKQLSGIGITTSSNYLQGGILQIDEAKLKKAIEEDLTAVEKLFTVSGSTEAGNGIISRLTETTNQGLEKLRLKAGNSFSLSQQFEIGRTLDDVNSRISKFEERMVTIEDRYWRQFTAMEKAIQKSNSQMAQLSSYFQ
jgi:flagellar hook-associated protein 2